MTEVSGTLTDYDLMTEGQFQGRYGARIDDNPYPVMQHVDPFLLRLQKKSNVIATVNENGWIEKIIKAPVTSGGPVDIPITSINVPKPEKPACYKSAICPKSCDGNPETCSVKKPTKKASKKSETPLADKLEKVGFKPDAKPGVTETMTDAEFQDMKVRAAKEAERKAAKEQLARDEEILRAAQAGKEVKPEPLPEGWTYSAPEGGIEGIVKRTQEITAKQQAPATVEAPMQILPAHPMPKYTEQEMLLLRHVIAKDCTEPEFRLMMYMSGVYGLDPLLKQIWAVKRKIDKPAIIFVGRDGMLAIAHRSGKFDGMQSGVIYEGEGKDKKPVSAWCKIWRTDMSHPFESSVLFSEYAQPFGAWLTHPSAMILKVSEAVGLRKAFVVSGVYDPDEFPEVR